MNPLGNAVALVCVLALLAATACQKKSPAPEATKPAAKEAAKTPNDCDDDHDHGKHPPIDLGSATAGAFTVKAARDGKAFKAGCDAPFDVWISGGSAKVAAVRFWIGLQDAKSSLKAKAEIENPAEPDHWHTHVEIPNPIPAGCKIWVEIETSDGAKATCGFDPKA